MVPVHLAASSPDFGAVHGLSHPGSMDSHSPLFGLQSPGQVAQSGTFLQRDSSPSSDGTVSSSMPVSAANLPKINLVTPHQTHPMVLRSMTRGHQI